MWNGSDISHLFREKQSYHQVHFSWETRSGETFRIIAHEAPRVCGPQYDLLIDGKSFFGLPRLRHLRIFDNDDVQSDISSSSTFTGESVQLDGTTDLLEEETKDILEYYESIVSMPKPLPASQGRSCLEDDLTSELFSNNLESLRSRASTLVVGVEDILSRALIHAFSEDPSSSSSFSSLSCENSMRSPLHIESNAIWDTLSWIRLNVDYAPRSDVEDQTRIFLQKQMDVIFSHVRQNVLREDEAVRIFCSTSELLGFEMKTPVRKDTVLIHGLNPLAEEEEIIQSLKVIGEVIDAHVAKGRNFAICRFREVETATTLVAACSAGTFQVKGETPVASLISPQITSVQMKGSGQGLDIDMSSLGPTKPSFLRRKSHQRSSVIIDSSSDMMPFITAAGRSSPGVVSLQSLRRRQWLNALP